jgi:hypothetical protein
VRSEIAPRFGVIFATVLCLVFGSPSPSRADQCVGDCNGDGRVTVSELITGINVELGGAPVSACPALDCCGSLLSCIPGTTCLFLAVHDALYGCRAPTTKAACLLGGCEVSADHVDLADDQAACCHLWTYSAFPGVIVWCSDVDLSTGRCAAGSCVDPCQGTPQN